jgi:uncharacterized membrane protein
LANGAVTTNKLATDSVITDKILDGNVTTPKLATDSVITDKILDGNVTTPKLATDAVITDKILDGAVTAAKIETDLAATVLGLFQIITDQATICGTIPEAGARAAISNDGGIHDLWLSTGTATGQWRNTRTGAGPC